MNKDLQNQLSADEQPIASKLDSLAEDMQLSPSFQWELETQLMNKAKTITQPSRGWQAKIIPAAGWALLALFAVLLLNWTIRSLVPELPPAAAETAKPPISFEDNVRQGNICSGPLALAHGFEVFLTNEDKTGFVPVDTGNTLDELRSFTWSADGERLAVVGNTTGSGNIYITDPTGGEPGYLLSASEAGYLRDAVWSRDGQRFVLWSSQNITTLYLLSALGHGLIEKQLDVQILGTPQFAPDGNIVFYGADRTAAGLFTLSLEPSQPFLLMPEVEDESGFAFSPDVSLLAYMEYDRDKGEARLSTQKLSRGEYRLLGTLPILRNPGSSVPEAANLSWSPDGSALVFEFGRSATDRAIYLAYADGTGLVKLVDSAHAPTISGDGKCLAYISEKQVFLLDLSNLSPNSAPSPVLLAELPTGRSITSFLLDKMQWQP
jgi:dipeptidyl aminopeptidase/acylaminoacyl peptidase